MNYKIIIKVHNIVAIFIIYKIISKLNLLLLYPYMALLRANDFYSY